MLSLWILGIIVSIFLIRYFIKRSEFRRKINAIPGPPGYPIIGNLLDIITEPEENFKLLRVLSAEYYPIYKIWAIGFAGVFLVSPDDIEQLVSSQKYIDKSNLYDAILPWLNTGLLTSTGSKWQKRRKILTPAFHFNILQQFLNVFVEHSISLVKKLEKECDEENTDVIPYITETALHSISETAMGTRLDENDSKQKDYFNAVYKIGKQIIYRLNRPWMRWQMFYNITGPGMEQVKLLKILHNFTRSVITQRKASFKETDATDNSVDSLYSKKRMAMLDLLLSAQRANGEDIDDDGIREEVDTFMFEGHDTTSMSMCFTLMILANHPDIQEKIVQEMQDVFGEFNAPPTYQQLQELPYMERCLKESLRLYPSVPFIARSLQEDLHTKSGYVIPPGCSVNIPIYDVHRNPEIFPEPEKFDPDRFLPDVARGRHPYAYIPFSAGPRNCIGQRYAMLELKTIIALILRNYILEAVDKPTDIVMVPDLVLRAKGSIRVKFRPRNLWKRRHLEMNDTDK